MASLYVTHRPQSLDEIVGNEITVQAIKNMFDRTEDKAFPHAFLFHGPSGCGKTTLARILAESLGCSGMDLTEIDTGDLRGIDTIREIKGQIEMSAMESECRVWIIDEAHRATGDAQSALLKSLEDTPEHVFFILCTTDPDKLLPTIRGRCTSFQVNSLKDRELMGLIKTICRTESWNISADIIKQVAKAAMGSPRQALVILDKIQGLSEEQVVQTIAETMINETKIIDLCRALVDKKKDWEKIVGILDGLENENPESIRLAIMGYFKKVIKSKEPNMSAWWVLKTFYRYPTYNLGMTAIWIASFEAVFMVTDEGIES